jgi:hypothetical protein
MACLLAKVCGLLRVGRGRVAMRANVCLPCGRSVAGFGKALFGVPEFGLELFEFGGFGAEGLLSVEMQVNGLPLMVGRNATLTSRSRLERGCLRRRLSCCPRVAPRLWKDQTCYQGLRQSSGRLSWMVRSAWSFAIARECCIRLGTWGFSGGHDCGWRGGR